MTPIVACGNVTLKTRRRIDALRESASSRTCNQDFSFRILLRLYFDPLAVHHPYIDTLIHHDAGGSLYLMVHNKVDLCCDMNILERKIVTYRHLIPGQLL